MEIYTIEAILLVFLILITCAVIFCKDILSASHHLQRVQLLRGAPVPHDGFSGCGFHRSGHWYDLYDLLRSIAEEN